MNKGSIALMVRRVFQVVSVTCTLIWTTVKAADYYVSPTGNDTNAGSQAQPWRTLQYAATKAMSGDSVVVQDGVYTEVVKSQRNGRVEAPITFRAAGKGAVVSGFVIAHGFHVVEGFVLPGTGITAWQGTVKVLAGGDGLIVRRNTFASSPELVHQVLVYDQVPITGVTITENVFRDANYHALALTGTKHLVRGNYFTCSKGWDAIRLVSSETLVANNRFENWSNLTGNSNHPDLIQAFSNNGETVLNNIIEGNVAVDCVGTQIGNLEAKDNKGVGQWTWRNNIWVNVEASMSIAAPGMVFYNNLFYRSGKNTVGPILFRNFGATGEGHGGKVFNNIFVECGNRPEDARFGWYSVDAGLTGFEADYNLVIGTGLGAAKTDFQVNGREANGINGRDPMFVDPAGMKFQLKSDSPCLGRGINLSNLFNTDIDGVIRGATWDIGPYQHERNVRPPANLRIVPKPQVP